MDEGGTVLHLARSGRLIIKANPQLRVGAILVDDKGKKVAKVLEIFGPVRSPYASAQPLTDRVKKLKGEKVYIYGSK